MRRSRRVCARPAPIILGKGNLSEWANFRSTRSSQRLERHRRPDPQRLLHPYRNPSGSSAGSAVAAAASFCAGAVGTETNGSILSPSSLNGLVGLQADRRAGERQGRGAHFAPPGHGGSDVPHVADAALLAGAMAERPLGFGITATTSRRFACAACASAPCRCPRARTPILSVCFAGAQAVLEQEGARARRPEAAGRLR